MPRLDNWAIVKHSSNPYAAPEGLKTKLVGSVWSHPDHRDGEKIVTSSLVALDSDRRIALTHYNVYELGDPDPEWTEWLNEQGHKLKEYDFDTREM